MGNSENSGWLYFWGLQKCCRWWLQPWKWKTLTPWKESYDQPRQHIKKQRHYFVNKGLSSQGYGFSSSHVWCESWTIKKAEHPKKWTFLNCSAGEESWESLDWKIQLVHPKGDQSWIFFGRTDAEAETPVLCPPDVKNCLIWKNPDALNDWRWEKGITEHEMVG